MGISNIEQGTLNFEAPEQYFLGKKKGGTRLVVPPLGGLALQRSAFLIHLFCGSPVLGFS